MNLNHFSEMISKGRKLLMTTVLYDKHPVASFPLLQTIQGILWMVLDFLYSNCLASRAHMLCKALATPGLDERDSLKHITLVWGIFHLISLGSS